MNKMIDISSEGIINTISITEIMCDDREVLVDQVYTGFLRLVMSCILFITLGLFVHTVMKCLVVRFCDKQTQDWFGIGSVITPNIDDDIQSIATTVNEEDDIEEATVMDEMNKEL